MKKLEPENKRPKKRKEKTIEITQKIYSYKNLLDINEIYIVEYNFNSRDRKKCEKV